MADIAAATARHRRIIQLVVVVVVVVVGEGEGVVVAFSGR